MGGWYVGRRSGVGSSNFAKDDRIGVSVWLCACDSLGVIVWVGVAVWVWQCGWAWQDGVCDYQ